MATRIPVGSTGRSCPEGLTWWRAGCGKTARPVREGRGLGNHPLTFIVFVAVTSVARLRSIAILFDEVAPHGDAEAGAVRDGDAAIDDGEALFDQVVEHGIEAEGVL